MAQSSAPPRDVIGGGDLDLVWTPRKAEPEMDQTAEEVTETKRPSLIARLFGRKKKQEQEDASFELSDSAPAPSELEPTASDFADAPSEDDFAMSSSPPPVSAVEEPASELLLIMPPEPEPDTSPAPVAKPSLDHSADDAAALADFLAASAPPPPPLPAEPIVEVDLGPTAKMPAVEETEPEPVVDNVDALFDAPVVAEESVAEEEPVAESASSFELIPPPDEVVAEEPSAEETEEPADGIAAEAPADEEANTLEMEPVEPPVKKPGFFARLFSRKSKPVEVEEEVEEETEIDSVAAEAVETDGEVVSAATDAPAIDEAPTDTAAEDDARRAEEEARWGPPAVEPAAELELQTPEAPPQPYSFRDARDDFEEPAEDTSRKTEEIDQQAIDPFAEGETTDEFEVVPPPAATGADAPTAPMAAVPASTFFNKLFGKKEDEKEEDTLETTQQTEAVPAPHTATVTEAGVKDDKLPFVLAKFRMFYNEIIRDKHQKSDVIAGFATAIVSSTESQAADPEYAAQLLAKRLSEMLELQAAEANWTGGDAVKYYPEAQYAMVCLADETFLTIDWPGRPSWHKYMLEPRMYQTRQADTEFFRRVDKLLREENPPKGARDLARVYLFVIASGFRGLFREPNLTRPLAEYRRRLYEFSHGEDPLELYAKDRKVFTQAEKYTLAGKAVGRFTAAQKWIAAVILLIVVYGTLSHLAWKKLSADLKDAVSRIETTIGPGGAK
ncbi:MAG TPA: DotU family type IV/VI secretion system protein [Gemmatimonadaceae bacterium]